MASSVSSLNNYSNFPLFNFGDLNLLASGMAAMQGRIDQNKAELKNIGNQLSMQFMDSMSRNIDKQYLNERLNEAMNLVETYANSADLSDSNVASKLSSKLTEVVDDRVLDAIHATTIRRIEEARIKDIQKNDPEKYSDINFSVYNKEWQKYVNSEDPFAVYSGNTYHDYFDYFKALTSKESLKMIEDMGITGEWIQRQDGGMYFDFKNKYAGTQDIARLQQVVQQIVGENGLKQMQINAEYYYGDFNNPNVLNNFRDNYNTYYSDLNSKYASDKEALEIAIKNSKNQNQRETLQSELDKINRELDNVSNRDFDTDVSVNGILDPNKYRNMYTTFGTNTEMQRLTNLMYQKPRLIDSDIEDTKLDILKFKQSQEEFAVNTQIKVANLEWEKEKFTATMASKGFNPDGTTNSSNTSTNISRDGIVSGLPTPTSEEEIGNNISYTLAREEQQKAIDGVNNLVGGNMNPASTLELMQELTGRDISNLKEITIAGRVVKINEDNRGEVLLALNKFKSTFLDGTSTVRKTRDDMSQSLDLAVGSAITHFRDNSSDHSGLAVNDDNFYFEKTENGQYEYKRGKYSSSGNMSNYQYLMTKASKNGRNSLNKAEKATLDTYVAKGIIADRSIGMNDWQKQQLYGSLKENIFNTLKSSKAINTMPTFNNVKIEVPSSNIVQTGVNIGLVGDIGSYVQISTEEARDRRLKGQSFVRVNSGEKTGTYWVNIKEKPTVSSLQDRNYSGIGWTDGWALGNRIKEHFEPTLKLSNTLLADDFRTTAKGSINMEGKSPAGKSLSTFIGTPIPDKAIISVFPEIKNNKTTGKFNMSYSIINKKGETEVVIPKSPSGNDIILTEKDLDGIANSGVNTIYNSSYGIRAGKISLGSSSVINDREFLGSLDNDLPSEEFLTNMNTLKNTYRDNPNILNFLISEENKFINGDYSFELSNGGVKDGTYKLYMKTTDGKQVPIFDTGFTSLNENTYVKEVLQNKKAVIEDAYFKNYIGKQIR